MSQHNRYTVGIRNVGSYQVSGHPFVTGSALNKHEQKKISFPYITKKIDVVASGSFIDNDKIRIHFTPTGSNKDNDHQMIAGKAVGPPVLTGVHFIELLDASASFTFDVKCKEIYLSNTGSNATAGFQLYASLTNIPTASMYELTGTGLTEHGHGPLSVP